MGHRPKLVGDRDLLPTSLEEARLYRFLAKAEKEDPDRWLLAGRICRLILRTGLRAAEVGHLLVQHCEVASPPHRILVYGGKKRRQGEADAVVISDLCAKELRDLCKGRDRDKPVLLDRDFAVARQTVWKLTKRAMKACGWHWKLSAHSLRHRFCTNRYLVSRDILFVKLSARHRSSGGRGSQVTERYINLAEAEEKFSAWANAADRLWMKASQGKN